MTAGTSAGASPGTSGATSAGASPGASGGRRPWSGVGGRVRSTLDAGVDAADHLRSGGRATPRVRLTLGRCVPGAVVRLAPVALVAAVGALVQAAPATWAVLGVLATVLVVRPALPAVAGVVLMAGLVSLAGPDLLAPVPPGRAGAAGPAAGVVGPLSLGLLVLCLDALLRLAGLTPHVAWTARVEVSVLGRLGASVARTQALAQALLWLAFGLRAGGPDPADGPLLRILALVAAGVLLAMLVPRRGRTGGGWGPP